MRRPVVGPPIARRPRRKTRSSSSSPRTHPTASPSWPSLSARAGRARSGGGARPEHKLLLGARVKRDAPGAGGRSRGARGDRAAGGGGGLPGGVDRGGDCRAARGGTAASREALPHRRPLPQAGSLREGVADWARLPAPLRGAGSVAGDAPGVGREGAICAEGHRERNGGLYWEVGGSRTWCVRPGLQQNLRLYNWLRVGGNAVFWLPVFMLYFSSQFTPGDVLLLESIYYAGIVAFDLPSGYLSDRVGRKPILVVATIAWALGSAVLAGGRELVRAVCGRPAAAGPGDGVPVGRGHLAAVRHPRGPRSGGGLPAPRGARRGGGVRDARGDGAPRGPGLGDRSAGGPRVVGGGGADRRRRRPAVRRAPRPRAGARDLRDRRRARQARGGPHPAVGDGVQHRARGRRAHPLRGDAAVAVAARRGVGRAGLRRDAADLRRVQLRRDEHRGLRGAPDLAGGRAVRDPHHLDRPVGAARGGHGLRCGRPPRPAAGAAAARDPPGDGGADHPRADPPADAGVGAGHVAVAAERGRPARLRRRADRRGVVARRSGGVVDRRDPQAVDPDRGLLGGPRARAVRPAAARDPRAPAAPPGSRCPPCSLQASRTPAPLQRMYRPQGPEARRRPLGPLDPRDPPERPGPRGPLSATDARPRTSGRSTSPAEYPRPSTRPGEDR